MEKLIIILSQFDYERRHKIGTNWNADAVKECFERCAKEILCHGYFLINKRYIIDIGAIELYYHEEKDGGIKDYIMYHTNAHPYKSKMFEIEKGYPYFKFGSFNLHQSGLDVTFENPDEKYRASFLIRSYRLLKTEDGNYPINDNTKYDHCSTHIFDDMFYEGFSFCHTLIEWKTENKGKEMDKPDYRINVPMYREKDKDKMKYEKLTRDYMKEHQMIILRNQGLVKLAKEKPGETPAEEPDVKTFKANGKEYVRDQRPWRFYLKGIYEKSKEDGK